MPDATPTTPAQYLKSLPDDRRKALAAVRKVINDNLPKGYKEGMQYGMIGWFVPHSVHPAGYHCDPTQPVPFASLASQKNHMALYLFCIYTDEKLTDWFVSEWKKTGVKLDMGKSCIRFKKLEDVPLDLIGKAISKIPMRSFLDGYLEAVPAARKKAAKTSASKKSSAKKSTSKKPAAKKPGAKKPTARKTTKRAAGKTSKKTASRRGARGSN